MYYVAYFEDFFFSSQVMSVEFHWGRLLLTVAIEKFDKSSSCVGQNHIYKATSRENLESLRGPILHCLYTQTHTNSFICHTSLFMTQGLGNAIVLVYIKFLLHPLKIQQLWTDAKTPKLMFSLRGRCKVVWKSSEVMEQGK